MLLRREKKNLKYRVLGLVLCGWNWTATWLKKDGPLSYHIDAFLLSSVQDHFECEIFYSFDLIQILTPRHKHWYLWHSSFKVWCRYPWEIPSRDFKPSTLSFLRVARQATVELGPRLINRATENARQITVANVLSCFHSQFSFISMYFGTYSFKKSQGCCM